MKQHSFKFPLKGAIALALGAYVVYKATRKPKPELGTTKDWGVFEGARVVQAVVAVTETNTDLQVVCVFELPKGGDIYNSPPALPEKANGLVHIDKAMDGGLMKLRESGEFGGHYLETMMPDLKPGTIKAKKLLLIGLGDRNDFDETLFTKVGQTAVREALKLGVKDFAFASNVQDAGVDADASEYVTYAVTGMLEEYRAQKRAQENGDFKPLESFYVLSGQKFFDDVSKSIHKAYIKLTSHKPETIWQK